MQTESNILVIIKNMNRGWRRVKEGDMGGKAGVDASVVQPVVGTFGHWDGTDGSELVF